MANNKVVLGNETLIDLTGDTVDAAHLASGYTAHNSAGEAVTGTMEPELYYVSCSLDLQTFTLANFDRTYSEIVAAYNDGKIVKLKANLFLGSTALHPVLGDLRLIDVNGLTGDARVEFDTILRAALHGSGTPLLYHIQIRYLSTGTIDRHVNQIATTTII